MAASLFNYSFTVRMHDIDAAGVLFFARNFYYIHDAYEAFLKHNNLSIAHILQSDFILPISHTEADYKAPVFLNETIHITIFLKSINENEFSLNYQLSDPSGKIRTSAATCHVCLDKKTRQRKALPDRLISILK